MKRDMDPPWHVSIYLDNSIFRPRDVLRWLGYWFTPSLSTTPHFTPRLAKAQAAFVAVKGLSPPGMRLPPFLCHRLASSLIFPILRYGGDVFAPTVHVMRNLLTLWHKVQRWCTNCFVPTRTDILAIEACLAPMDLFFSYKRRLAGLRILCSPPEINPATARLPPSVRTHSPHRHASDHRALLKGNAGCRNPLSWLQPRPTSKRKTHLPLDAIPHSLLFLLGPDGLSPLPVTSPHLLSEAYPAAQSGRS